MLPRMSARRTKMKQTIKKLDNILLTNFLHILVAATLFTAGCLLIAIGYSKATAPIPWSLSKAEIKYITAELDKKNAPDCTLEPTLYGFKCTTRDKQVYRIYQ
jgi:hypothetical protein